MGYCLPSRANINFSIGTSLIGLLLGNISLTETSKIIFKTTALPCRKEIVKYVVEVSNGFGWSKSIEYMKFNLILGSNLVWNILHGEHGAKK